MDAMIRVLLTENDFRKLCLPFFKEIRCYIKCYYINVSTKKITVPLPSVFEHVNKLLVIKTVRVYNLIVLPSVVDLITQLLYVCERMSMALWVRFRSSSFRRKIRRPSLWSFCKFLHRKSTHDLSSDRSIEYVAVFVRSSESSNIQSLDLFSSKPWTARKKKRGDWTQRQQEQFQRKMINTVRIYAKGH